MGVQFLLRPPASSDEILGQPTTGLLGDRLGSALALALEAKLTVEAQVLAERALMNNRLLAADVVASDAQR